MNARNRTAIGALAALFALSAQAGEFNQFLPAKSAIGFVARQMNVPVEGSFKRFSGQLDFDPARPAAARATLDIDLASIDAGSGEANDEVAGKLWFNTRQYPGARFVATSVKALGGKPVAVDGKLTIKGITKPVTLTLTSFQAMPNPMTKKNALGANAVTKIKRSDFNMGKYAPAVSDDVVLSIPVEAILAAGQADMVALARGMLYDPCWPWHAATELGAQVVAPDQYQRSQPRQFKTLFRSTRTQRTRRNACLIRAYTASSYCPRRKPPGSS